MKNIFYLIIIFAITACGTDNSGLTITFENAEGLEKGTPVEINDYQIGVVDNISINTEYKIEAEISLTDTISIPDDSKFIIEASDFFTKIIKVYPGKSTTYLTDKDLILGQQAEGIKLDSIIDFISNEITNSQPVKNQDSIITELKILNKELEE